MTAELETGKRTGSKKRAKFKKNMYMYFLLAPALIAVIIFAYCPLGGILIAFKDYDVLLGFAKSPWVGFKHFVTIFTMPNFLQAIKNTLVYSSILIFGYFPFPIILALMFNEVKCTKFKKVSQTITYLPHFLSWISVIGFCYSLLALNGGVNDLLAWILGEGYERKNILLDSKYFVGVLFFTKTWKDIGWASILYLAAITGIDPSLYEAASIDGCNKLKQVWHVTLPGIRVTCVISLIMAVGNLVNTSFEQIYGFQNVYIQEETEVINTLIYRQGIQSAQYSPATAFGLFQGLVSLLLVTLSNTISKKLFEVGIW